MYSSKWINVFIVKHKNYGISDQAIHNLDSFFLHNYVFGIKSQM